MLDIHDELEKNHTFEHSKISWQSLVGSPAPWKRDRLQQKTKQLVEILSDLESKVLTHQEVVRRMQILEQNNGQFSLQYADTMCATFRCLHKAFRLTMARRTRDHPSVDARVGVAAGSGVLEAVSGAGQHCQGWFMDAFLCWSDDMCHTLTGLEP